MEIRLNTAVNVRKDTLTLLNCLRLQCACALEHLKKNICPTWLLASRSTYRRRILLSKTVSSGSPSSRKNLSPFTKDFRGGEQLNESID